MMFHQSGAAFHPITVVHVDNAIYGLDLGMMDVATDHAVVAFFLAIGSEIPFKFKYEIYSLFHAMFEIAAQAPVTQTQPAPYRVETAVEIQHKVIGLVAQETEPGRQARDAIKHVTVRDKITPAVCTYMFHLIRYLNQTKRYAKRDHGTQKLIMIACYEYHPGATFGMTQYAPDHVGMALAPAPFVLLYLPGIYHIPNQIQSVAGVMFEKIVETIGLTITGAQMYI